MLARFAAVRYQAGYRDECPKRYTGPANLVEQHILDLIRQDLLRMRDDEKLHEDVQEELRRLNGHEDDARDQLQRRLASVDQQIAKLREHLLAMNPETADSLGLYRQADELTAERATLETDLNRLPPAAELPATDDLRDRIAIECQAFEDLLAAGTLEERRELISSYVKEIKADPDTQTVQIGLYPTVLSQRVAGARYARHRHGPESSPKPSLKALKAVFWAQAPCGLA